MKMKRSFKIMERKQPNKLVTPNTLVINFDKKNEIWLVSEERNLQGSNLGKKTLRMKDEE
jgi:hypothetical protein